MTFGDGANAVPHPAVGAIIVAAGESRRMGGVDKIFAPLMGGPMILHSLRAFHDFARVQEIVLVLSSGNLARGRRLVQEHGLQKVKAVCAGGQRRQDSVRQGLHRLSDCEWVIVHDGARPLIREDLIARGLSEAVRTGSAVPAVPVKDTIKTADDDLLAVETLQRDRLWAVHTPQVFRRHLLVDAHERVSEYVTDDASMVERIGRKVQIFMGDPHNIKVTTPEDLPVAEAILRSRAAASSVC